jgi:sec-independent protein translocase protein TatA
MIGVMAIFFGILGIGGWEMVLLVAVVILLFGARKLPDIRKGFGEGLSQFRKAFDREAESAGESLGGIFGKPAAQALTPDNRTAELYDPAVFRHEEHKGRAKKVFHRCRRFWRSILQAVLKSLKPRSCGE